jgi:hypothetical protein
MKRMRIFVQKKKITWSLDMDGGRQTYSSGHRVAVDHFLSGNHRVATKFGRGLGFLRRLLQQPFLFLS